MQRMLFENIESRIIVGASMFVGIIFLVGWIAINENARMEAFQERSVGRSIERGAALYADNCASCHGRDGLGITGSAPALNDPHLFGYDFGTGELTEQIAVLDAEAQRLRDERDILFEQFVNASTAGASNEELDEILSGIDEIDAHLDRDIEGSLGAEIATLGSEYDDLSLLMETAVANGYDPARPDRLDVVDWSGGRAAFIYTTLVHGRPSSVSYWVLAMPHWSQLTGGPLRDDQLEDLTNYVMNFDRGERWTVEDLNAVRQFPVEPGIGGGESGVEFSAIGVNLTVIMNNLENTTGDPARGEALYNGEQRTNTPNPAFGNLACAGCHTGGIMAPDTAGAWSRAAERLSDPALSDYTVEQYVVESILVPAAYTVEGYTSDTMPPNFGERIDLQALSDLIAYLRTLE